MADKSFAKAVHKINYDLINNTVAGEEISESKRSDMKEILSFWEQKLFENIASSSPVNGNALSYFMQSDLFQQISNEIINEIDCQNVTEGRELILKNLIHEMGDEILEFSSILIDLRVFMKIKLLKDYVVIIVNMLKSHGRLNYKNIGLGLLEKEDLRIEDKYIIACYFCLEYKVKELVNKLPTQFLNKIIKDCDKGEICHLMALWYFQLKEKKENFKFAMRKLKLKLNEINDAQDHVCLMIWAIKKGNAEAVQFIWNKLFEENDKKNSHKYAELAIYELYINIVCYFVSKFISDDQIENFYVNNGHAFLALLASDSRWREYFIPTSEYILQYINKMNFICTFKTLTRCWIVNEFKRDSYNHYFEAFISKFNVKMNKNILYSRTILKILIELENRENINLLLIIESADDIKKLFVNNSIINIGLELVLAKKFEIFENFLEDVIRENEVMKFKNHFFHFAIDEISSHWDENDDRDAFAEFKNKFCCSLSSNTFM